MKTIFVIPKHSFNPSKHITLQELQHIISQGKQPPTDKTLILFTYFSKKLHPSEDDLRLNRPS